MQKLQLQKRQRLAALAPHVRGGLAVGKHPHQVQLQHYTSLQTLPPPLYGLHEWRQAGREAGRSDGRRDKHSRLEGGGTQTRPTRAVPAGRQAGGLAGWLVGGLHTRSPPTRRALDPALSNRTWLQTLSAAEWASCRESQRGVGVSHLCGGGLGIYQMS